MDFIDVRASVMLRTRFQLMYEFGYTPIERNLLIFRELKVRSALPGYSAQPQGRV